MSEEDQLKAIRDALSDWAGDEGGKAFIASDLLHMWNMAVANSKGPRCIVCYRGEEVRGSFDVAAILGRVDRQFVVAVVRGRGFAAERGDSVYETIQNNKPFVRLVSEAREIIRSMVGVSEERPVDFKAIRPMGMAGQLMDAYEIHFSVAADLPQLIPTPEETTGIPA